jgi:hypothetical protein
MFARRVAGHVPAANGVVFEKLAIEPEQVTALGVEMLDGRPGVGQQLFDQVSAGQELARAVTGECVTRGDGARPATDIVGDLLRELQRLIDNRHVFARMGLTLVNDLAAIKAVLQHQVERPARERLAADHPTRSARPRLAFPALGFELLLQ